ncbi:phosphoadenosine phosphosulfate reductase domain-containing protein [Brumimicrobium oceani]|uniref:Phosphoadenylylsulfate reductase n=1 Tax=Brumimicrobium oceani TaxID=2100725 RepID=A0A2U2XAM1_9FLAO|nr:phosphoadenosine phosphosulfate reductase family protein [Brumimicrobium oceani]PWH84800.1 phosphoadenylylsulfate reductase [Brumimicrobium oceani]
MDIKGINAALQDKSPEEIVEWAIQHAKKPVVTTNFRPYESAILHLTTKISPQLEVVWCDTGYNTSATYRHAKELIENLNLNIHIYVPQQSVGYRNVILGIPEVDSPAHKIFSDQVKLEPFQRAMKIHAPDIWFTNLRKGQTAFRDGIDIVSQGKDGVIKVSPFYNYSDEELDEYLTEHHLPNEKNYYDPTKVLENRECGIHN